MVKLKLLEMVKLKWLEKKLKSVNLGAELQKDENTRLVDVYRTREALKQHPSRIFERSLSSITQ
jgi:hypothetical protein